MIGRLFEADDLRSTAAAAMSAAWADFRIDGPIVLLGHFDAYALDADEEADVDEGELATAE